MSFHSRLALLAAVVVGAGRAPAADEIMPSAASRTYVYILDGVNPLRLAGTHRLADRLRQNGFQQVQVGGWYSGDRFEREIRAAHLADPSARFALIGFSAGSYTARSVANRLVQTGVPVAVVGYLGGDYLRDTAETRVPGAGRVVNVTGDGYVPTGRNLLFNGTDVSGAMNVRLAGTAHYDLPTHPRTFATLYAALSSGD
jgi:hypothetical protein